MTALLHQPTHATAELHWLAEQVRIETDQRNFGGSWRSLRAARSDRHDLADREGPTRTTYGGSRRSHWGLPTQWAALWRFTYGSWRNMADQRPYSCAALPPPRSVYVWLQLKWRGTFQYFQSHVKIPYTVTPFKFAAIKVRGFEIMTYSRPFNFAVSY